MASASIPAVLPPVSWEGRVLMDGGVANNTPTSHAIDLGAQQIYVLPTGHACALEQPPRGALTMALNALSILTHQRLSRDIEKHAHDADLIVLPPPCPLEIPPTDFTHEEILIGRGYADACQFLDAGGADRPPIRMRVHHHNPRARRKLDARRLSSMSKRRPAINENPTADAVMAWRTERLRTAGLPDDLAPRALRIACDRSYDLHALLELVDRGCPAGLAVRILAPIDEQRTPC
jgi:Patatin-like phospholipase